MGLFLRAKAEGSEISFKISSFSQEGAELQRLFFFVKGIMTKIC